MDDSRIEQFKKMAEADPENELGHFSLGKAYLDAKRYAEAAVSLGRVVQLNPQNSRAYQMLASAQRDTGDRAAAVATLRKGFEVAHARGDLMPRNEMAAMLKEFGEAPPVVEEANTLVAVAAAPSAGQIICSRCGKPAAKMPERPFKGPLGEKVWVSVCMPCWQEWIRMGTKVINELRLNFADPRHADVYDQHMKEFLNVSA